MRALAGERDCHPGKVQRFGADLYYRWEQPADQEPKTAGDGGGEGKDRGGEGSAGDDGSRGCVSGFGVQGSGLKTSSRANFPAGSDDFRDLLTVLFVLTILSLS